MTAKKYICPDCKGDLKFDKYTHVYYCETCKKTCYPRVKSTHSEKTV